MKDATEQGPSLACSLWMMFTEQPLPERFAAAARAGFDQVEVQFPYEAPAGVLAERAAAAGIPVALINTRLGDQGDLGLACLPDRAADYEATLFDALPYLEALKPRWVNVLAGRAELTASAGTRLKAALRQAADLFEPHGAGVALEVINPLDQPGYAVSDLQTGLDILAELDDPRIRLQLDFYHMARIGNDPVAAVHAAAPLLGHVQFADAPGRHEPGTGSIDFAAALRALREVGYRGVVSAEYRPAAETTAGLAWMAGFKAALAG